MFELSRVRLRFEISGRVMMGWLEGKKECEEKSPSIVERENFRPASITAHSFLFHSRSFNSSWSTLIVTPKLHASTTLRSDVWRLSEVQARLLHGCSLTRFVSSFPHSPTSLTLTNFQVWPLKLNNSNKKLNTLSLKSVSIQYGETQVKC